MTEQNPSTPPPPEAQQAMAQAAAETAAAGGTEQQVATAAQDAARAQGYELTDEQAAKLAQALATPLVTGMIAEFEKRGVFREEPEPVTAPVVPATAAPDAPADVAPPPAPVEPPRRQTWAERHFG